MKKFAMITGFTIVATLVVGALPQASEAGLLFRRSNEKKTEEKATETKARSIIATAMAMQGPTLTLSPAEPTTPAMTMPAAPYIAGSYQEPLPTLELSPMIVPPCISYRYAGLRHVKCCLPPIKTCLTYTDPCTCCQMCIPVCLPGCCTDCPDVSARGALFAKELITYDWCCGVSVTVRLKRDGEILVTYRGV